MVTAISRCPLGSRPYPAGPSPRGFATGQAESAGRRTTLDKLGWGSPSGELILRNFCQDPGFGGLYKGGEGLSCGRRT